MRLAQANHANQQASSQLPSTAQQAAIASSLSLLQTMSGAEADNLRKLLAPLNQPVNPTLTLGLGLGLKKTKNQQATLLRTTGAKNRLVKYNKGSRFGGSGMIKLDDKVGFSNALRKLDGDGNSSYSPDMNHPMSARSSRSYAGSETSKFSSSSAPTMSNLSSSSYLKQRGRMMMGRGMGMGMGMGMEREMEMGGPPIQQSKSNSNSNSNSYSYSYNNKYDGRLAGKILKVDRVSRMQGFTNVENATNFGDMSGFFNKKTSTTLDRRSSVELVKQVKQMQEAYSNPKHGFDPSNASKDSFKEKHMLLMREQAKREDLVRDEMVREQKRLEEERRQQQEVQDMQLTMEEFKKVSERRERAL